MRQISERFHRKTTKTDCRVSHQRNRPKGPSTLCSKLSLRYVSDIASENLGD
jgi:hypothetical protein